MTANTGLYRTATAARERAKDFSEGALEPVYVYENLAFIAGEARRALASKDAAEWRAALGHVLELARESLPLQDEMLSMDDLADALADIREREERGERLRRLMGEDDGQD